MNYDSYLARAIEIFNDKMDADFSGDNIILTCFMTEDQEEIFEQFCSKYFPYRLNDRYQEEGYFDFRRPLLSGWITVARTASCSARTYPIIRLNCSTSFCMSWRISTAFTMTGREELL